MRRDVTFRPELRDHVAGQRLWYSRALRRPMVKLFLAALVFLEVATLASIGLDLAGGWPLSASLLDNFVPLLTPLLVLGLGFWNWRRMPARVRRMTDQQPSLFSETEWRWDDEMVVVQSAAGSSRIEWGTLYRWLANDETILVIPQERLILTLPRRVLHAEQAADLIATMERFAIRARRS